MDRMVALVTDAGADPDEDVLDTVSEEDSVGQPDEESEDMAVKAVVDHVDGASKVKEASRNSKRNKTSSVLHQNDAAPEPETGPAIEIAENLSVDGAPAVGDYTLSHRPDPSLTPPPSSHSEVSLDSGKKAAHSQELLRQGSQFSAEESEDLAIYDRLRHMDEYKLALEERSKIQQQNSQLQHKLAEYFKKKKTDDRPAEMEKNVTDQEQRYIKYMSNLEELQREESYLGDSIHAQTEDLKTKCLEKQERVQNLSDEFCKLKYDIAKSAINSRTGKAIPYKDLEQLQAMEAKKEQEVIAVRLENIKLRNRLKKRELQLKAKEELAEGLHLIDFEQLKIENQTYNEKIEERNEEILKLRKKITTTVQVLTHLKEKLQFVQGENCEQRAKLRDIEVTVANRRDILTHVKQVRDSLRLENTKLKHKSGLLGNELLLRDLENRRDESSDLREQLGKLTAQHVDLKMSLTGLRKKIARSKMPPMQAI